MGGSSSKQERPRNARPLQETTRDLKYLSDKGIVAAECQNPDGNWTWSYLNLNDCLRRNPFNNISAFKGAGRTLGDSYDWPLINREADGEKQTVELAGHTLKVVVDDDKKGRTELSINLLDHLVNWYGVLEFAAP